MRSLLALIALCLTACNTPAVITLADGTSIKTPGRVGGQGIVSVTSGQNTVLVSDDNEDSFRELNKTGRFLGGTAVFGGIAKTGINAFQKVSTAKTAADVSMNAAGEATNQAAIQATTDQARIAAEAAALATP